MRSIDPPRTPILVTIAAAVTATVITTLLAWWTERRVDAATQWQREAASHEQAAVGLLSLSMTAWRTDQPIDRAAAQQHERALGSMLLRRAPSPADEPRFAELRAKLDKWSLRTAGEWPRAAATAGSAPAMPVSQAAALSLMVDLLDAASGWWRRASEEQALAEARYRQAVFAARITLVVCFVALAVLALRRAREPTGAEWYVEDDLASDSGDDDRDDPPRREAAASAAPPASAQHPVAPRPGARAEATVPGDVARVVAALEAVRAGTLHGDELRGTARSILKGATRSRLAVNASRGTLSQRRCPRTDGWR